MLRLAEIAALTDEKMIADDLRRLIKTGPVAIVDHRSLVGLAEITGRSMGERSAIDLGGPGVPKPIEIVNNRIWKSLVDEVAVESVQKGRSCALAVLAVHAVIRQNDSISFIRERPRAIIFSTRLSLSLIVLTLLGIVILHSAGMTFAY